MPTAPPPTAPRSAADVIRAFAEAAVAAAPPLTDQQAARVGVMLSRVPEHAHGR